MSKHSKWATTKRWKAVVDARRGNAFTKLGRDITVAVRTGGADLESNFKLRLAIERARDASMPKDNIDRAVKKGTGEMDGEKVEEILYEGFGPNGIALVIETITDNRNRTVNELKHLLVKIGGSLGTTGSTIRLFDRLGVFQCGRLLTDEETLLVIDAGAKDIEETDDGLMVSTASESFQKVKELLVRLNVTIKGADLRYVPKETVAVENTESIEKLLEELEGLDDVQNVYCNAEI
ncbi:MAG: YebC/PmpR family DNA-binding transcriptional regulator [bacterium]